MRSLDPMIQDLKRKETHDKLDSHTRMYVFMGQMDSGRKGKIESGAHCGFEADTDGPSDNLEDLEDVNEK